ncbi:MAG: hypothetical protein H6742_04820 [Alphaproteobacteria bacterium]|nr:hypothetical protein [Alphaproteobacteria bacterium]
MSRASAVTLALVGLVQLLGFLVFASGGYISIDEVGYDWQGHAFASGSWLSIDNGYEALHSGLLALTHDGTVVVKGDRLVSKYPPLLALLAAPLYGVLGPRALVAVNGLSLVALAGAVLAVARRWRPEPWLGPLACLLLWAGSPLGLYGLGTWPHALALALELWALERALAAHDRGRAGPAAVAGLLLGLALCARLDAIFLLPAIAWPLLGPVPLRWRSLGALVAGLAGPTLALGAVNLAKFGVFQPFTYGRGYGTGFMLRFAAIAAGGLLLAGVRLAWESGRVRDVVGRRWRIALGLSGAVVLLGLLVPEGRSGAMRLCRGLWMLFVDFRALPLDAEAAGLRRLADGSVSYLGGVKKALLQGAPVMGFGLAGLLLPGERRVASVALGFAVLFPALAYSFGWWHGGQALSMRYLLPVLVPLALGAARLLGRGVGGAVDVGALDIGAPVLIAVGTAAVGTRWLMDVDQPAGTVAAALGDAGAGLAIACLVLGGLMVWRPATSVVGRLVAGTALGWGLTVALVHDLPLESRAREGTVLVAAAVAPALREGDVLFYLQAESFAQLASVRGVVLASADGSVADRAALVASAMAQRRAVYAAVPSQWASDAMARLQVDGYQWQPASQHGGVLLVRLLPEGSP